MIQKKIILDSDTKIDLIDIEKIAYIRVDSMSAELHLINGVKYHSNKNLVFFENSLPDVFLKINRNTIVNTLFIVSVNKLSRKITLEDNVILSVSVRQLKKLTLRLKPVLIHSSKNS